MTFSTTARLLKVFVAAIALMCTLLIAANSIPNGPIADNVRRSLSFQEFQLSPIGAHLDEFTECVAVSVGLFSGHNVNAVGEAFRSPVTWGCSRLKDEVEGKPGAIMNYWRFWHGYQIVSRPLLYFFSLRLLHIVVYVSFCASVFVFYETVRAHIGARHAAFALAALLCVSAHVYSGAYLVSHAVVWLPAFLGAAWLLRAKRIETHAPGETLLAPFLLLGMATSFLGYMTTPLVTLTIPLTVLYWAGRGSWIEGRQLTWRTTAQLCAAWGVGYIGCWAMKWVIVAAFLNPDVSSEILAQVSLRLTGAHPTVSATDVVIDASLANSFKTSLWEVRYGLVGLAGFLVFSLGRAFREHGRIIATNPFKSMDDALTFATIFMLPLVWIGIVRNHTVVDPWFAPGILYTCFALSFWLADEALGARTTSREQTA
jgi:hypothetical protein